MTSPFRRLCLLNVVLISLLLPAFAAEAPQYVVVIPVANMYSGATQDTDVVSQALYGTNLFVVEQQENWVKLRTPGDDYLGWVPRSALLSLGSNPPYASAGKVVEVSSLMAHLYREPDVTEHAPLLTVSFETRLEVASTRGERWLQVRLPDGRLAWVQAGDVVSRDKPGTPLTIEQMVALAKRFMGLPYTWGGRSAFGYDCSGFTQMLMRQRGYYMPRDADIQAAWTGFVGVERAQLRAGDLLYFGSQGKITHTAMYIGNDEIIHATTHNEPVIQISRLSDPYWTRLLVAQRRVKQ